jgi:hypothetical protein
MHLHSQLCIYVTGVFTGFVTCLESQDLHADDSKTEENMHIVDITSRWNMKGTSYEEPTVLERTNACEVLFASICILFVYSLIRRPSWFAVRD